MKLSLFALVLASLMRSPAHAGSVAEISNAAELAAALAQATFGLKTVRSVAA
ncbi:MAG: hypothetical protein HY718_19955 [Planctomycetes bacterium]|nr:hypothetical protein [Planctomycetota bacterium]